jgi:GNAT superfamily N-acetyltransferase
MTIAYRSDKGIPVDRLIELYTIADYNQWWTERNVRAWLDHCYFFLTAWADDQLVGTVSVVSDGVNYAHIDDLLVHPSFRNRRVGTRLLEEAIEKIKPLNLKFVQLIKVDPFVKTTRSTDLQNGPRQGCDTIDSDVAAHGCRV